MKWVFPIWAALLGLQAVPASAGVALGTVSLDCSTASCTGPATQYGTVSLADDSKGGFSVTVQLADGYRFATGNSSYAITWNVGESTTHTPDLTIKLDPGSNPGNFAVQNRGSGAYWYKASPFTVSQGQCNDGCFDYAIAHTADASDNRLIFDMTASRALALTDFTATSGGFTFASRIVANANPGNSFYVASRSFPVPEPQTWTLVLGSLLSMAGLRAVQRRKADRLT